MEARDENGTRRARTEKLTMRLSKIACAVIGLAVTTACGGVAHSLDSYAPSAAVGAGKTGCHGTGHVRVEPCPITIRGKRGVIASVRGPGVVKAYVYETCDDGICIVKQHGAAKFKVQGGYNCGGPVQIGFEAWDSQNQSVGYGYAPVTNNFCP